MPYMDPMGYTPCYFCFCRLAKEYNDVDVAVHQPSYDTLGSPSW